MKRYTLKYNGGVVGVEPEEGGELVKYDDVEYTFSKISKFISNELEIVLAQPDDSVEVTLTEHLIRDEQILLLEFIKTRLTTILKGE